MLPAATWRAAQATLPRAIMHTAFRRRRTRQAVIRALGVLGALDPYIHKLNHASLSGEGRLEQEGVRALKNRQEMPNRAARSRGPPSLIEMAALSQAGEGEGMERPLQEEVELIPITGEHCLWGLSLHGYPGWCCWLRHAARASFLLSRHRYAPAGLMTSSPDFFPAVAINALVRILIDPSMTSHRKAAVVSA